jgi:flavin reductase (DIM6/NTAB) family NADH-FMN oxidoreductase RutF
MPTPDTDSFRQLMGCFATGITVVTAQHKDGGPIGITINSLTSVSLKPPLVLFCLDKSAHVYSFFKTAPEFVVNFLGEKQDNISRHFADFRRHAEPKNIWERSQKNFPILRHTLGWMLCRKVAVHNGGDHDIFLGEALKLHKRTGPRDPLLYFHGRYRKIGKEK